MPVVVTSDNQILIR